MPAAAQRLSSGPAARRADAVRGRGLREAPKRAEPESQSKPFASSTDTWMPSAKPTSLPRPGSAVAET
ncbi:hypothetical protein FH965_20075 [Streptomyces spectabilis]|uniref:Uncharacterized protein n=1 Tax=Streptomyces spectabilis TaxID=68270 RepID=A0A516RA85_STRST|nr:hypothetical protein FH965_20075 [Streptomyces spectabilis]